MFASFLSPFHLSVLLSIVLAKLCHTFSTRCWYIMHCGSGMCFGLVCSCAIVSVRLNDSGTIINGLVMSAHFHGVLNPDKF